jgi:type IV pilus assembly protein PilY1
MIAPRHRILSTRRLGKTCLGAVGLFAVSLSSTRSFAQAEAQKPSPNVLLLVDSSGSMEFKTNGEFPTCDPVGTTSERSRWIDLVEVLTGQFAGYSCWKQDRSSADFRTEFSMGSATLYDYGYVNPYHRPMSNLCAYGPGVAPSASSPYEWPNRAVNTFPFTGTSNADGRLTRPGAGSLPSYTGCANFTQTNDGLLDVYKDMVRFGLMTFDARVGSGTGLLGTAADYPSGFDGNWSYYRGSPKEGHPINCDFPSVQEVGARNAAAPPWEGRMIGFGPPNETDNSVRNRWIQEVLLSTRPYGATPIAGQLDDAREFLWNDISVDPFDSTQQFGPTNDPNWRATNCRKTILILLTDGEPNLDLRPFCDMTPPAGQPAGLCPYERPEDIVASLRTEPPQTSMAVETYVVGFALGSVRPAGASSDIPCSELTSAHCSDPANDGDDTASKNIQACCTLNKIANAGGQDANNVPRNAYFAENRAELKAIFTDILDDVIKLATRTMPVYSSPGGDATSRGYKFFSAFNPQPDPTETQLWKGVLQRRRFVCTDELAPELAAMDPLKGDDFTTNVNSAPNARRFYTVIAGGNSANSIRPFLLSNDDGLGTSTSAQVVADPPSELAGLIPAASMGLTGPAASCPPTSDANGCRDLIINHLVGINDNVNPTRCPASGCSVFGGIYHSVPTTVPGRPSDLLRDESYEAFTNEMAALARPSVLYTSTVDGFLHAFNLAPFPGSTNAVDKAIDSPENNELWSFLPPAVLPVLHTQYPKTPMVLLDGVPIIKDVVATKEGTGASAVVKSYERLRSDAEGGGGFWRTVLVQGFGEGQVDSGYFALDITDPDPATPGEPTFRWQLTRNASDVPLFGSNGTPLITTVFLDTSTGDPREVAVAVLPGGDALNGSGSTTAIGEVMTADPGSFTTTREVRVYPGFEARSLTIVRLDTGEVIRTFRPEDSAALFDESVFTATVIPAPITGQPKAFPEITGAVADRIYVGDRDGRMYRVDVSSQDAEDWTMKVFYDAFEDGAVASSQPVVLPPVLSVDDVGDVTVAFATGTQTLDNGQNRVISLTERLNPDSNEFEAHVNWIHTLDVGDRVTGPMVLFNRGLYYSVSRPPATTGVACDVGSSKVYGAQYIESADFEQAAADGTDPDPTSGPAPAPNEDDLVIAAQPGLVFGLSLEAEPTCASEEEAVSGNDSFGYGEVRMSRTVNPGKYFLTFAASGNDAGGAEAQGVLQVRQELESPRLPVTFSSWAAVYE